MEDETSERVKDYARITASEITLVAYKADIEHFIEWGGVIPDSLQSIANYLTEHAGVLSVSTLSRRVAPLSIIHEVRGLGNPTNYVANGHGYYFTFIRYCFGDMPPLQLLNALQNVPASL